MGVRIAVESICLLQPFVQLGIRQLLSMIRLQQGILFGSDQACVMQRQQMYNRLNCADVQRVEIV